MNFNKSSDFVISQNSASGRVSITDKVSISNAAALKIKQLIKFNQFLRISVTAGGCAGFQYDFSIVDLSEVGKFDEWSDDDSMDLYVSDSSNCNLVVIDNNSLAYVLDSVIDYQDTLERSGFVINNPRAKSGCGCGNSFSVK